MTYGCSSEYLLHLVITVATRVVTCAGVLRNDRFCSIKMLKSFVEIKTRMRERDIVNTKARKCVVPAKRDSTFPGCITQVVFTKLKGQKHKNKGVLYKFGIPGNY